MEGLDGHLTYLSNASVDRLYESHSLLQTVIWAIPIVGFLGTVMGITLAIANVTPDQLDSSLNDVTAGLAVAFDTTALALSLSLVLGFGSLFVKRSEERLLAGIDERCRLEVHRCFPVIDSNARTLIDAEAEAAETLVQQTNEMITRQTHVWSEAIESIREQWTDTLDEQRRHLIYNIRSGAESTLSEHARTLSDFREQFLNAQSELAERLTIELERIEDQRTASVGVLLEKVGQLSDRFQDGATRQVAQQQAATNQLLENFSNRVEQWQQTTADWQGQLRHLTEALLTQSESLHQHGSQLERVVAHEESLLRLQDNLNRNLETIRTAESFDETLHNLTAAVHILTARTRSRDAA